MHGQVEIVGVEFGFVVLLGLV